MAKKGARILIGLACELCHTLGYVVKKNKINTPSALKIKKYCRRCHKHTVHKEQKKLK
jgi:large subunit ribosomal protein L33